MELGILIWESRNRGKKLHGELKFCIFIEREGWKKAPIN
jgi:hypothetical protein